MTVSMETVQMVKSLSAGVILVALAALMLLYTSLKKRRKLMCISGRVALRGLPTVPPCKQGLNLMMFYLNLKIH